jgi:hypothetical protein
MYLLQDTWNQMKEVGALNKRKRQKDFINSVIKKDV